MSWYTSLVEMKRKSGLTTSQIAEKSGVPLGTLNKLFAGQTADPKLETIRAVVYALGGTLDSIDNARKPTPILFPYSAAALELARQYDQLDSWGQAAMLAIAREEMQRCTAPAAELAEIIELPHSLLSASAGTGQWLDDDTADIWEVRLNEHTRKADFAVDVAGNSMEPLYFDGDTVLVHAQPAINEGEIGLYVYRGDGYIKRQGDGRLHSLNPEYPDIVPCDGEAIVCKGLVLGKLDDAWIVSK